MKNLRVQGIFSHLCVSDMQTPQAVAYTRWQTQSFQRAVQAAHAAGFEPGQVHLQASYGVLNGRGANFTCARVGIALYGVLSDTTPTVRHLPLRPALALHGPCGQCALAETGAGGRLRLGFCGPAAHAPCLRHHWLWQTVCRAILPCAAGMCWCEGQRAPAVGRVCIGPDAGGCYGN